MKWALLIGVAACAGTPRPTAEQARVTRAYELAKSDPPRGAALHQELCLGGVTVGCVNFGVQLATGDGVAQDRAHAARLFRAACQSGKDDLAVPVACVNLGVLIDAGLTEPAGQTGMALFDRACHAGYATGCRYAGLALLPSEPARADDFLHLACVRGDLDACAVLDRHGRGDPIEFEESLLFARVTYHPFGGR